LEHQRKRAIEVKLMEMRDAMEERGLDEGTIEARITESRARLLAVKPVAGRGGGGGSGGRGDSHQRADRKERENAQLRGAFRIQSDFVPGEAFDRDRQEQRKQERRDAYQRKEEGRRAREAQRERQREDRERERTERERAERRARERSPPRRDEAEERSAKRVRREDGEDGAGVEWHGAEVAREAETSVAAPAADADADADADANAAAPASASAAAPALASASAAGAAAPRGAIVVDRADQDPARVGGQWPNREAQGNGLRIAHPHFVRMDQLAFAAVERQ
jgi:hypothetical protein